MAADDRFEMVTEPALSLVVFRLRAGDEQTLAAMEAVNASGEAYLSHTTVNGRAAIRLAVGSWRTTAGGRRPHLARAAGGVAGLSPSG